MPVTNWLILVGLYEDPGLNERAKTYGRTSDSDKIGIQTNSAGEYGQCSGESGDRAPTKCAGVNVSTSAEEM